MSGRGRRGYYRSLLRALAERCCLEYREIPALGIPKGLVKVYVHRLVRREGVATKVEVGGRRFVCLKVCVDWDDG